MRIWLRKRTFSTEYHSTNPVPPDFVGTKWVENGNTLLVSMGPAGRTTIDNLESGGRIRFYFDHENAVKLTGSRSRSPVDLPSGTQTVYNLIHAVATSGFDGWEVERGTAAAFPLVSLGLDPAVVWYRLKPELESPYHLYIRFAPDGEPLQLAVSDGSATTWFHVVGVEWNPEIDAEYLDRDYRWYRSIELYPEAERYQY